MYSTNAAVLLYYCYHHLASSHSQRFHCYYHLHQRQLQILSFFPNQVSALERDGNSLVSMVFGRWLCTHSTRSMLVKIVHPGGHVELHDQPLLAAEIMLRNPRCCVAYPNVFHQPWAIVAPNVMLMQGQKFYVVPISTIRKLQRLSSLNQSSSPSQRIPSSSPPSPLSSPSPLPSPSPSPSPLICHNGEEDQELIISSCWFCFTTQSTSKQQLLPYTCSEHSDGDETSMGKERSPSETRSNTEEIEKEEGCVSDDDKSIRTVGSSQRKDLVRKRTKNLEWKGIRMPHKKKIYLLNWQPRLESITEE